jgi:hypothetical protein
MIIERIRKLSELLKILYLSKQAVIFSSTGSGYIATVLYLKKLGKRL